MSGKTKLTFDASVLAKWFIEEEGSSIAVDIRDRYIKGEVELSTSSLARSSWAKSS